MLNKEKYKEKIWEFILNHGGLPAITKKGFKNCKVTNCHNECLFFSPHLKCEEGFLNWLNSEYVELEIDWTKVPVDMPILVSYDGEHWHNHYFAKTENGKIYVWNNGRTSWSAYGELDYVYCKFIKLANEEDAEKYRKG